MTYTYDEPDKIIIAILERMTLSYFALVNICKVIFILSYYTFILMSYLFENTSEICFEDNDETL